jgi:hypothetical protein
MRFKEAFMHRVEDLNAMNSWGNVAGKHIDVIFIWSLLVELWHV